MSRRLFTIGAAVSLVLCVAVVALWVRSLNCADAIAYHRHRTWDVWGSTEPDRLILQFNWHANDYYTFPGDGWHYWPSRATIQAYDSQRRAYLLGFFWLSWDETVNVHRWGHAVIIPFRWLITAFAIPPSLLAVMQTYRRASSSRN